MGAIFSCCLKGLENLGFGAAKVNRRQALQSLLKDREDPNVDGRKNVTPPAAFEPGGAPTGVQRVGSVRGPAGSISATESPGSPPRSPTPSSLLNGRDRGGSEKRTNFGSFQQRSSQR